MSKTIPLSLILGAVDQLSGPLGKMSGKLGKFAKQATKIGKSLTVGVTLPTLALGGAILNVGGDFEESMINLQALSGESAQALSGLSAQARELGGTTIFDADMIGRGMGQLKLAGLSLGEIGTAIPQVLDFAAASTQGFTDAAQGSMQVMKGMGMEVGELTRITDTLMNAQAGALVQVPELIEGFASGGSTAATYGLEVEAIAASLALLNERGAQAGQAGTVLRQVLGRLIRPAAEGRAAFAQLELAQSDFFSGDGTEKFLGFANAMEKLSEAKPSQLGAIFGEKAGPGFMKLLAAGPERLREFEKALEKGGLTQKVAQLRMTGLNGQLKAFWSAVKEAGIAVGESGLLTWFTGIVKKATTMLSILSKVSPQTLKWGTIIAGVAATVGPFLIALGFLAGALGSVISAGAALGITWAGITGAFAAAGAALATAGGAIAAFLTAPLTLAVAAVAATGAGLVWLYNKFDWFAGAADFVGEAFMKVFRMVRDEFMDLWEGFVRGYMWVSEKIGLGSSASDADAPDEISAARAASVATGGGRIDRKESTLEIRMPGLAPGTRVIADNLDDDIDLELGFALE